MGGPKIPKSGTSFMYVPLFKSALGHKLDLLASVSQIIELLFGGVKISSKFL